MCLELKWMMYDQTGSEKSNVAASKLEVPIYQLVDKIGTVSQRLYQCLRNPAIQWEWLFNDADRPNRKREIQDGGLYT